ncbi:MAG: Glu/Leu/Phe/Val dehydrogenase dimerization domain-containing protein [Thermoanaerobaculia bacterium]|nr:Glu/Leu/Phe/Val dehydrogenase dimerization domain-containing protein [Thermoanaerobaculia bacterium]
MHSLESLLTGWPGEVVMHHDDASDAWIFIACHDRTLGRPVGGTRIKVYPRPADGLHDALRLARGMTEKWAIAGLPVGGGKAVLALSRPVEGAARLALLERYGRLVESLNGAFGTGQDLGSTPEDMAHIGRFTRWVHGLRAVGEPAVDPGPYTARGVYAGIRAALRHLDGSDDPAGKTIVVEGVGGVGRPLAESLAAAGARLVLTDAVAGKAEELATRLNASTATPEEGRQLACDVYAPCAVGATISAASIPELRCRIVGGSANNQLAEDADAQRLHERGILYAPDYVINGGGATAFHLQSQGVSEEVIGTRLDAIGDLLTELFRAAAAAGISPLEAAEARVQQILAAARQKENS